MEHANALVQRATIDGLVGHRDAAMRLFADAHEAVQKALEAARSASGGSGLHLSKEFETLLLRPTADDFVAEARRLTDRGAWNHVVMGHGFEKLMDRQAMAEFRGQIDRDPPEFSAEIAEQTMRQLMGDSAMLFRRGVANAFSGLDRRFRSHDGFKVGSRIVLERAFGEYGQWNHHRHHQDTLRDIEKAFFRLDGREPPDSYAGIVGAIDSKRAGFYSASAYEADSEYIRVKVFINGNCHLWFTRKDLVAGINRLLAEHYGEVLGDASDERTDDPLRATGNAVVRNMGWFPTPEAVCDRIIGESSIVWTRSNGRDPTRLRVLEPSADEGAIALHAIEAMKDGGAFPAVTCVELHPGRASSLRAAGFVQSAGHQVVEADFLSKSPDELGLFDRILMNPPFDRQTDVDHVAHAARFLAPDGILVAIMSAGVEFRENAKAVAFRALVERMDGRIRDLPAGSFAESGTMINTCIVTLRSRA